MMSTPDEDIFKLLEVIKTQNTQEVGKAMTKLSGIFLMQKKSLVTPVIDAGILPYLKDYCHKKWSIRIQIDASTLLTCLTTGTSADILRLKEEGVLQIACDLLEASHIIIIQQAVWIIVNMTGYNNECRQMVLKSPIIAKLIPVLKCEKYDIVRALSWMFYNLTQEWKPSDFKYIKPVFPQLVDLLAIIHSSEESLEFICSSIVTITEKCQESLECLAQTNILPQILLRFECFCPKEQQNVVLLIRLHTNLTASSNEKLTDYVISCGFVQKIATRLLVDTQQTEVCKQICLALANITKGTRQQATRIYNNKHLLGLLMNLAKKGHIECRRQVAWVFINFLKSLQHKLVAYLYKAQNIPLIFVSLLAYDQDIRSVEIAIEGIKCMFIMSNHFSKPYFGEFIESFRKDLVKLSLSKNQEVMSRSKDFLEYLKQRKMEINKDQKINDKK